MTNHYGGEGLDPVTIDEFVKELYVSAYRNEESLHDVEPGYEYAVNQLLSDLRGRTQWFNNKTETEMIQRAQQEVADE